MVQLEPPMEELELEKGLNLPVAEIKPDARRRCSSNISCRRRRRSRRAQEDLLGLGLTE